MGMKGLTVILGAIGLLAMSVACGGDGSPQSAFEGPNPEGVTWVLRTMYGEPVLDGTFVWLRLDGDGYEGLDGCNRYGGQSGNGTPVVGEDGELNALPIFVNQAECETPGGVMEQSDEYRRLLARQGQSLRVEGNRLEILDWAGEVGLVFIRQVPLPGKPVELVGTGWQLVVEDSADENVKAATLAFVDDHLAVGATACRGYAAHYRVWDGRMSFPAWPMTESGASLLCADESRRQEGRYTNDLSQAIDYSVSEEDGTRQLRIRTSRGRTVTFEPLAAGVESVFGVEWRLRAFVTVGKQGDPDVPLLRVDRVIPGTKATIQFNDGSVWGAGGCNFYDSQPGSGGFQISEDGSMDIDDEILPTAKLCTDPTGIMEQEKRFRELIPQFERYRVYEELLVIHTLDGIVLLFQA